eukprot:TRINITY_DN20759_c0_g3_i1.p1 TRINITY_DN20759_c0_g3~~TRINITY_DN20759_c0_g3_i1.p1  ORF type:complete len:729 (-),score=196.92 TRINITY_DN20759_c0_g3_i1:36-2165(-)
MAPSLVPISLGSLAALSHVSALDARVTPTEKVIKLLDDLAKEVKSEGETEAAAYDKFACFCKDKTSTVSSSIKSGQDSIDSHSSDIEVKTATKGDKSMQLKEATAKRAELTQDLEDTTLRCQKEQEAYEANNADLSKAISSLENAKQSMESSKPAATAGLLTMKSVILQNPDIAAAMRLIDRGPQWDAAASASFLQQRASVDPADPAFKYHSQSIIDTLTKLHGEFTDAKSAADTEWAKTKSTCDKTKTDLGNELGTNKVTIETLQTDIQTLAQDIGTARSDLLKAQGVLKDDELYLTDLTAMCEKRAQEYDQRSALRSNEAKALQQALKILREGVQTVEAVNERALLQQREAHNQVTPPSFVQTVAESQSHGASIRVHDGTDRAREMALELLRREGARLSSSSLSMLVVSASDDPFKKIKTMIQKLVERLVKESTAEATKKGFCDTELGKAKQERDFRSNEVNKLNAEINALEVKAEALEMEKESLGAALTQLSKDMADAKKAREEDKAANMEAVKKAREGLEAVTEALNVLSTFYKEAAKATAFVQVARSTSHASPVDVDDPGAGFDGAYSGKQEQSKGVVGLLEVIKSDFERTLEKTAEAEKEAAAEYVEFDRASKASEGGKNKKLELDAEDLSTVKSNLETKMGDMQSAMNLIDAALKEIEELKPACIDNVMSYAERVQKREDEMAALKKALCILDTDGVEEECK